MAFETVQVEFSSGPEPSPRPHLSRPSPARRSLGPEPSPLPHRSRRSPTPAVGRERRRSGGSVQSVRSTASRHRQASYLPPSYHCQWEGAPTGFSASEPRPSTSRQAWFPPPVHGEGSQLGSDEGDVESLGDYQSESWSEPSPADNVVPATAKAAAPPARHGSPGDAPVPEKAPSGSSPEAAKETLRRNPPPPRERPGQARRAPPAARQGRDGWGREESAGGAREARRTTGGRRTCPPGPAPPHLRRVVGLLWLSSWPEQNTWWSSSNSNSKKRVRSCVIKINSLRSRPFKIIFFKTDRRMMALAQKFASKTVKDEKLPAISGRGLQKSEGHQRLISALKDPSLNEQRRSRAVHFEEPQI
ncbi:serine/arginine repetitive matrix protein 1-like [Eublepharis macularius]|uniref:Serine/arginine repetitive matrix protein 1-like n=1 Tax=Eublepharis macularius TaxID=481883 RepID=A0AA97L608_EUBMA|nr:serine/arginine repetitive matrix protein 1-like [Eublepharis macularius]